jgi:hypothetical protein
VRQRERGAPTSADHIAAEGARSRPPHERGSLILSPTVSMVSIGAEVHHDYPARDPRALAAGRLPEIFAPRYLIRDRDQVYGAVIASHGHPRQTYRSRLALAERLRRKIDRIDPTRVRRPCDRLGRGAPTWDSASPCPLLQRSENAPIVGQRCAILAPGSADWSHHVACALGGLHHRYMRV